MPEYRFTCSLLNGLHARPASMLVEVASRFAAAVTLCKVLAPGKCGDPINARSVLSLVGLDVKHGEVCIISAEGPDAAAAIAAFRDFIENKLVEGDEVKAPNTSGILTAYLPIGLRHINISHTPGIPVGGGVGIGEAVMFGGLSLTPDALTVKPGPVDHELSLARTAITALRTDLEKRATAARSPTERDLLRAHASIASDPALWTKIEQAINSASSALAAVVAAARQFADHLRAADSTYIRDRAIDVQDVASQLLDRIGGRSMRTPDPVLTRPSVVFAEGLTPSQLLKIDRRHLKGLILGHVGPTSHTIILARSLRIPTLINVTNPTSPATARRGDQVIVDADGGFLLAHISLAAARYYQREERTQSRWHAAMSPLSREPAATRDGQALEIGANASTADEVAAAVERGADGVGLLRTELLFLDRESPPTEEEQYEAYNAVVLAAAGRSVIIRTFDIGGDKPAPYLPMPREDNPFLGVRGLRLYADNAPLFTSQLRAILRAAANGPVKIMAPMVATPAEAAWFREQVRAVETTLASAGVTGWRNIPVPVGVMIEIPAAALVLDQLSQEVDFFSVGTNDLCQYFMAADRGNPHPAVTLLYNSRQPAFLRLLRAIADAARASDRWIGICGEMAGDPFNLPLMIGLNLDEISVAPGAALPLKRAARTADAALCRQLLDAACNCTDAHAVETLIRAQPWQTTEPVKVLGKALIDTASDALTKEEAIKDAVDLLYIAGRTQRPREVEEAVWAREATYSTGLGFGFAVPHCKSTTITAPTLAVLKLQKPIDWGSMDGQPVQIVLLLAIPAADTTGAHMKVFAKLARKLMHEEFREKLTSASNAAAVETTLREELGLD